MPRTKKPAPAAADLPIEVTTPAAPAKRASRSKAAIAERAVAQAEATGDYTKVNDAQVKLAAQATDLGNRAAVVADVHAQVADKIATKLRQGFPDVDVRVDAGRYDGMTAFQAEREIAEIDANLAELDRGVRDALLDEEIEKSVAALDDSNGDANEIVRSLASIGLGEDPLAEEAAAVRLGRHLGKRELTNLVDAVPYEFGTMIELPAGTELEFMPGTATQVLRPPLYNVIRDMVDILIATGQWVPPAGHERDIGQYWPEIKSRLLESLTGENAIRNRLLAAQAKKLELDNAEREPAGFGDTHYENSVAFYEQVLELEGKLATSETALTEAMALSKELARIAEVDRGIIARQDAKLEELSAELGAAREKNWGLKINVDNLNAKRMADAETIEHVRKEFGIELERNMDLKTKLSSSSASMVARSRSRACAAPWKP